MRSARPALHEGRTMHSCGNLSRTSSGVAKSNESARPKSSRWSGRAKCIRELTDRTEWDSLARKSVMPKQSAGLLMFRRSRGSIEVLLVHPGGPFWARKDEGAWSIPKGAFEQGEDGLSAARREFEEETGSRPARATIGLGI